MKKQAPTEIEQEIENTRKATLNLLEDLEVERAQLAIVNAKDEALLESLGDGIMATDEDGTIIAVNHAAEVLLNGKTSDFLGKKIFEVIRVFDDSDKIVPLEERPFHTAFITGKKTITVYSYERKDGTKFPAAITVTPIMLDGKIVGAIEIFRDITQERELVKAKDEFIALVSHQLKSPITAISWTLEEFISENKDKLDAEQNGTLEKIYEINKNMAGLIQGFLDATKMESAGFAIEKDIVDLVKTCDLVLEELADQILRKKVVVVKKYGEDIPGIEIGVRAAKIILQNLISNAIKYSPEGKTIEISIERTSDGVTVGVKDNGYGIPEEAKSKIFSKLFRADNAKEKEPLGTGLGLYLVKSLVDKVGGRVWFESKEGLGSTFYVCLKFGPTT